ncbi:cold-regulated 413 plasma membrane protein 2-like isoform X2 [Cynara cardunculus var. scolymus]|uniref:Cold acclimation protein WCOR413 n=1 Tax=Cynara cardunculus var. scolymus TaxID=59895 RepID=A0A103XKP8_CYNCS|nr:cold-regulated 413 plasma membrane protein 2-like isoform X2 [Cynara cardunculus var. scolymus]KVH92555.1 Cold acclimation protein WCOR413 [Cynara cardunculus var. scolymus]
MVRSDFWTLKTEEVTAELINADISELKLAVERLFDHVTKIGGLGFGTSFLAWVASFAAIYLLILDRTNWRSNILTTLLVPYVFFSLPSSIFYFLRGQFGMWVAVITVVLRLFLPRHFPDWLEMPGSMVLLMVVAPNLFAHTFRNSWVGLAICLLIGCYLLQEHIRASGGFRNSFVQSHGISNTIGILLLLVYPMWTLIVRFV